MLLRDLKRIANKCCINPKKPSTNEQIIIDVGNPEYWVTKAREHLMKAAHCKSGTNLHYSQINHAIELLILTQAYTDEKAAIVKKARDASTRQDSKDAEK